MHQVSELQQGGRTSTKDYHNLFAMRGVVEVPRIGLLRIMATLYDNFALKSGNFGFLSWSCPP